MTEPTPLPGGFIARRDFLQRAGGGIGKFDPSELRSERREPGAAIFHAGQQRRLIEALLDKVR